MKVHTLSWLLTFYCSTFKVVPTVAAITTYAMLSLDIFPINSPTLGTDIIVFWHIIIWNTQCLKYCIHFLCTLISVVCLPYFYVFMLSLSNIFCSFTRLLCSCSCSFPPSYSSFPISCLASCMSCSHSCIFRASNTSSSVIEIALQLSAGFVFSLILQLHLVEVERAHTEIFS